MDNLTQKVQEIQKILIEYGQNGYQTAKNLVLNDRNITQPVQQVLKYLLQQCWQNRQHPALISLACEAVGGQRDAADEVGSALVLLTGAADMHDDIVDKSKVKGPKLTAYGKFGQDAVLLAGDILILKAVSGLAVACEKLSPAVSHEVRRLVELAFCEIGCATAKEREYRGNLALQPITYRKIIYSKGSVSEACSRIGAIIGGGSPEHVSALGHFGRTLSVLMTLQNEFADMRNPIELKNRWKNEVLPLPMFYAFQNRSVKGEIVGLLKSGITAKTTRQIWQIAIGVMEVEDLIQDVQSAAQREKGMLNDFVRNVGPFNLLLELSTAQLVQFSNAH